MRDSARIDRVLALLGTHWKQHPDLRLGQIVSNIAQRQGIADVFYMEEAAIERDLLAEHEQTPALQVGQAGGNGTPTCAKCRQPMRHDGGPDYSCDTCGTKHTVRAGEQMARQQVPAEVRPRFGAPGRQRFPRLCRWIRAKRWRMGSI